MQPRDEITSGRALFARPFVLTVHAYNSVSVFDAVRRAHACSSLMIFNEWESKYYRTSRCRAPTTYEAYCHRTTTVADVIRPHALYSA